MQALGCGNDDYGAPAIRVVGNIATGSHMQTQVIIACGVLNHMPHFLHSKKSNFVKEACWLLSNVTAGTQDQIQAVALSSTRTDWGLKTLIHFKDSLQDL